MIQAGDLRERVTFYKVDTGKNGYGEQVAKWTAAYSCRARVQFKKGSRALGEGEVWNPTTVAVTVRYVSAMGGGRLTTQSGRLAKSASFSEAFDGCFAAAGRPPRQGAFSKDFCGCFSASAFWVAAPVLVAAGLRMSWRGQMYHVESCNIDAAGGMAVLTCSAVELSEPTADMPCN